MNYLDNAYPFRQDSTFLYFVGTALPGLAATIDLASGEEILFGDDASMDDIVWTGPQASVAERAAAAGIAASLPRARLLERAARERGPGGSGALLYVPPTAPETGRSWPSSRASRFRPWTRAPASPFRPWTRAPASPLSKRRWNSAS